MMRSISRRLDRLEHERFRRIVHDRGQELNLRMSAAEIDELVSAALAAFRLAPPVPVGDGRLVDVEPTFRCLARLQGWDEEEVMAEAKLLLEERETTTMASSGRPLAR